MFNKIKRTWTWEFEKKFIDTIKIIKLYKFIKFADNKFEKYLFEVLPLLKE